jgi:uncharacterized protein YdeI (YjbR/CyaY-like superfamily)
MSVPGIDPIPVAAPAGQTEGEAGLTRITVWESAGVGEVPSSGSGAASGAAAGAASGAASAADARTVFRTAADWANWLDAHHRSSTGLWLQLAKKDGGEVSVTYDEALRVALCYGWIDGQKRPLDDVWWLQRFTPRRRASPWSQRNRKIVAELIAEGRMLPAGQAEIDRAKADGRWDAAYAGSRTMEVPPDLAAALAEDAEAATFFATLTSTNRYAILYRLQDAKKPETRARRLEQFLAMLREGRTLYPQASRKASPGS